MSAWGRGGSFPRRDGGVRAYSFLSAVRIRWGVSREGVQSLGCRLLPMQRVRRTVAHRSRESHEAATGDLPGQADAALTSHGDRPTPSAAQWLPRRYYQAHPWHERVVAAHLGRHQSESSL